MPATKSQSDLFFSGCLLVTHSPFLFLFFTIYILFVLSASARSTETVEPSSHCLLIGLQFWHTIGSAPCQHFALVPFLPREITSFVVNLLWQQVGLGPCSSGSGFDSDLWPFAACHHNSLSIYFQIKLKKPPKYLRAARKNKI